MRICLVALLASQRPIRRSIHHVCHEQRCNNMHLTSATATSDSCSTSTSMPGTISP